MAAPNSLSTNRLDITAVAALAAFATFIAWVLRQWAGYPLNPSDERNWVEVATAVAQGVKWPVSGALHFATTRTLADWGGLTHADALAILGIASIPLVLATYAITYRLMGFARTWPTLLLLMTSTYFWAPLLESRPQQWGQALVALCAAIAWWVMVQPSRRATLWWCTAWSGWGLLFALTCWVHLLSGPIAFGLCSLLAAGSYARHPSQWPRFAGWALASTPGLLIVLHPAGPYRLMLGGLGANYLTRLTSWVWVAILIGLLVVALLVMLMRTIGPKLTQACLRSVGRMPLLWMVGLSIGIFAFLALQALMLPKEAWAFYRGSVAIFVVKQSGNLLFLSLLLTGSIHIATRPGLHGAAPWRGQIAMLTCFAVLAAGALAMSALARDTNWMLRIINYALPFAAPLAVLGLAQWRVAKEWSTALLLLVGAVSLGTAGGII